LVGNIRSDALMAFAERVGACLGLVGLQIDDDDVRPLVSKCVRCSQAQATGAARDQYNFLFQICIHRGDSLQLLRRMPAFRMMSPHCSLCDFTWAVNSSGVREKGSTPISANRFLMSSAARADLSSVLSCSMTALGVPAGAARPCHA